MCKGFVRAICSSEERGLPKHNTGSGYLKEGFGLAGDAHAGTEGWQVSILLEQLMEPVIKKLGETPEPGSFAENLLLRGLPENSVVKGTVLKVGEAIIEITAIGKEDPLKHTYSYRGFRLLAEQGRFGRIIRSGQVKTGDPVEIVES
ncbi:MAG TPA: MOSC domain-containing protein [Firmicutes bacterium]|nr:MOSC domain-containing protein [Bacillota bacterium]